MINSRAPMRVFLVLLCFFALGIGIGRAQDTSTAAPQTGISAERYLTNLQYLADDAREGRLPDTPGGREASAYIAEQFKAIGLKPAGPDGSYFQSFTIERMKHRHDESAYVRLNGNAQNWLIGVDWIPLPFSKPGAFAGPLAFAGYGISAPKFEFDDYADFDATGKVLIVLRAEPKSEDSQAEFGGAVPSRHALFSKKASLAAEHGALALLIVNQSDHEGAEDQLYPWYDWDTNQTYALPIVQITRPMADKLLVQGKLPNLTELQQRLDRDRKPLSADLQDLSIELDTGLRYIEGRNVLGILPGTGATGEFIVIGAHHDHVGNVPDDDGAANVPVIHNGADDNASGSVGVIELAHALAADGPYQRNILFMTFDGEEMGLLGSSHFVEHPTVPIDSIRAMINLDMIGRLNQNKFTIFGVGSAKEFRELLGKSAAKFGLTFNSPPSNTGWFGGSDHMSFYMKQIPVLFLFTNIHKQYHRAEDDWELVDVEGACKVLHLIQPVVEELANLQAGPEFIPAEQEEVPPDENENGESKEESQAESAGRRGREGVRVSLRLIPDHAYTQHDGLRVLSVIKNGPADKAGLRDGDLIVRIGENEVTDIYCYIEILKQFKPNQTVEIMVRRETEKTVLQVTLDESRRGRRAREHKPE